MRSILTQLVIFIIFVLLFIQACGDVNPPTPVPQGFDIQAGAPRNIRINQDEPLVQPYVAYLKVQVRHNDSPFTNQTVKYQIQDCENNWLSESADYTRRYQDLNPAGDIVQEDGFVVWNRDFAFADLCNDMPDRFYVSFALPMEGPVPEGQKWGAQYEITIIDDHEGSDVLEDAFKHQRDLVGEEVLGDGFHDAGDPDYNPVYGDSLDPNRKDLFIELDIPTTIPWIWNNLSDIVSTLKTIFNTAGVNIHVFDQEISNIEQYSNRNEIKAHLYDDRDLNLQRRALHVVVLGNLEGQPQILGQCIQLQGDPPNGDGLWDYECFDEVYDTQRGSGGYGALDSVGCVVFWEVFDTTALGSGWTKLDAFCRLLAHEIGHALGIYRTYSRLEGEDNVGCIMDDVDSLNRIDNPMLPHSMDFYKANVDNIVPGIEQPFSNAINLRDILGVNTTSFKSGNPFPDNINP